MPKNFKEKQISNYVFERYKIDLAYNFIDIHKLSKQILLKKDSMFGYSMLIEKSKSKEELIKNLDIIVKLARSKEKLEEITNIISYLLNDILEENIQEELLEKIERKVGEKEMSTLYDRLLAESKRDIEKGRKEEKRDIAKNMISKKLADQIILETTGIKKEELEKIKNQLAITG